MAHEAALLGAGQRGRFVYGDYAARRPDRLRFTAAADPDERRQGVFGGEHGIPPSRRFLDWRELLEADPPRVWVIPRPTAATPSRP